MAGNTAERGASVIARAGRLLGCFDGDRPRLTLTELSTASGLSLDAVVGSPYAVQPLTEPDLGDQVYGLLLERTESPPLDGVLAVAVRE
jgi:hypothetical protein